MNHLHSLRKTESTLSLVDKRSLWETADQTPPSMPIPPDSPTFNVSLGNPSRSPSRVPFSSRSTTATGRDASPFSDEKLSEILYTLKLLKESHKVVEDSVQEALFEFGGLANRSKDNAVALNSLQDRAKKTQESAFNSESSVRNGIVQIQNLLESQKETQRAQTLVTDSLLESIKDLSTQIKSSSRAGSSIDMPRLISVLEEHSNTVADDVYKSQQATAGVISQFHSEIQNLLVKNKMVGDPIEKSTRNMDQINHQLADIKRYMEKFQDPSFTMASMREILVQSNHKNSQLLQDLQSDLKLIAGSMSVDHSSGLATVADQLTSLETNFSSLETNIISSKHASDSLLDKANQILSDVSTLKKTKSDGDEEILKNIDYICKRLNAMENFAKIQDDSFSVLQEIDRFLRIRGDEEKQSTQEVVSDLKEIKGRLNDTNNDLPKAVEAIHKKLNDLEGLFKHQETNQNLLKVIENSLQTKDSQDKQNSQAIVSELQEIKTELINNKWSLMAVDNIQKQLESLNYVNVKDESNLELLKAIEKLLLTKSDKEKKDIQTVIIELQEIKLKLVHNDESSKVIDSIQERLNTFESMTKPQESNQTLLQSIEKFLHLKSDEEKQRIQEVMLEVQECHNASEYHSKQLGKLESSIFNFSNNFDKNILEQLIAIQSHLETFKSSFTKQSVEFDNNTKESNKEVTSRLLTIESHIDSWKSSLSNEINQSISNHQLLVSNTLESLKNIQHSIDKLPNADQTAPTVLTKDQLIGVVSLEIDKCLKSNQQMIQAFEESFLEQLHTNIKSVKEMEALHSETKNEELSSQFKAIKDSIEELKNPHNNSNVLENLFTTRLETLEESLDTLKQATVKPINDTQADVRSLIDLYYGEAKSTQNCDKAMSEQLQEAHNRILKLEEEKIEANAKFKLFKYHEDDLNKYESDIELLRLEISKLQSEKVQASEAVASVKAELKCRIEEFENIEQRALAFEQKMQQTILERSKGILGSATMAVINSGNGISVPVSESNSSIKRNIPLTSVNEVTTDLNSSCNINNHSIDNGYLGKENDLSIAKRGSPMLSKGGKNRSISLFTTN